MVGQDHKLQSGYQRQRKRERAPETQRRRMTSSKIFFRVCEGEANDFLLGFETVSLVVCLQSRCSNCIHSLLLSVLSTGVKRGSAHLYRNAPRYIAVCRCRVGVEAKLHKLFKLTKLGHFQYQLSERALPPAPLPTSTQFLYRNWAREGRRPLNIQIKYDWLTLFSVLDVCLIIVEQEAFPPAREEGREVSQPVRI